MKTTQRAVRKAMSKWGKMGGVARAKKLSKKRRRAIARRAALARWRPTKKSA